MYRKTIYELECRQDPKVLIKSSSNFINVYCFLTKWKQSEQRTNSLNISSTSRHIAYTSLSPNFERNTMQCNDFFLFTDRTTPTRTFNRESMSKHSINNFMQIFVIVYSRWIFWGQKDNTVMFRCITNMRSRISKNIVLKNILIFPKSHFAI